MASTSLARSRQPRNRQVGSNRRSGNWRASPAERRKLLPFALVPIYLTLVHTPISSGARYVVPGWHFVLILAALAITSSIGRAADKTRSSA